MGDENVGLAPAVAARGVAGAATAPVAGGAGLVIAELAAPAPVGELAAVAGLGVVPVVFRVGVVLATGLAGAVAAGVSVIRGISMGATGADAGGSAAEGIVAGSADGLVTGNSGKTGALICAGLGLAVVGESARTELVHAPSITPPSRVSNVRTRTFGWWCINLDSSLGRALTQKARCLEEKKSMAIRTC